MLNKRKEKLSDKPTQQKRLRLRPGVVIVVLQWLIRFGIPIVIPGAIVIGVFAGLLGGFAVVIWWAFFSRAPRTERWGGSVLMIFALVATRPLLHTSIAKAGLGMLFFVYAIPILSLAFVVWAVASRRSSCGDGRSDRAGRPSRSAATSSIPRSSAVTTKSLPATA